jgi:hypothetical protein
MDQFQADFRTQCATGCEPGLTAPAHRPLRDEQRSAELKGDVGVTMLSIGGAAAIAGAVLVLVNRPTRVMPDIEVAPHAGGATAQVGWRF